MAAWTSHSRPAFPRPNGWTLYGAVSPGLARGCWSNGFDQATDRRPQHIDSLSGVRVSNPRFRRLVAMLDDRQIDDAEFTALATEAGATAEQIEQVLKCNADDDGEIDF